MSRRLPHAASSRGLPVELSVAGATVRGFAGESVAAAALAGGVRVLSRSLKYHRPRSAFCMEGHCGGCLMRIDGAPNRRACQVPCASGLVAEGQNAFPSAEHDLLGAVDFVFARGLDHHTLMTSSSLLNAMAKKVVRQLSGLGTLPAAPAVELPPVPTHRVEVAVIGGGAAGLAAARAAAEAGAATLLVDDQLVPGGSLRADPLLGPAVADDAIAAATDAGAILHAATTAIAFFPEDDGGVLVAASERQARRVVARQWVWATGGYPVMLPIADNDRPGVLALRAATRLLLQHGILVGGAICVLTDPRLWAEAEVAAAALRRAGAEVTLLEVAQAEQILGRKAAQAVALRDGRQLDCDAVLLAALPSPATEGPRQQGCAVELSERAGGFALVVDADGRTTVPGVWGCGDVCGYRGPAAAAAEGARVGASAARAALGAAS